VSTKSLRAAADLLQQHYGRIGRSPQSSDWLTLVRVVLEAGTAGALPAHVIDRINETLLGTPAEVQQASVDEITAALGNAPRARPKAPVLKALGGWWMKRFGIDRHPDWNGDLDEYQGELRRIRGVSVEMADRILLFVGGRNVYPLDRGSLRIACRHGWMGFEAEYEEWQSFFVQGLRQADVDLQEFSHWSIRLGKDHCGPKPACEQCPLKTLLPEGAPYEPDVG
jgi:endonuclease III related protein